MAEKNFIRLAAGTVRGRWLKGAESDGKGHRCGLGHLWKAAGYGRSALIDLGLDTSGTFESAVRQVVTMRAAAQDKFPDRLRSGGATGFAEFNDHPETTEQDVIDVMTLAADRWDAENG